MKETSRLLALMAAGGAIAFAACGTTDFSPAASNAAIASDGGSVTSSGYGPGAPSRPVPPQGAGTCTNDCDGAGHGPGPGEGLCGSACTGAVGPDPGDISEMLGLALHEEHKAESLYRSVLETFGPDTVPFAAIAESEARHVEALQVLFARRQLTPPSDVAASFPTFASVPVACSAGVVAERADAAFYTPYLGRTDLPQDVRNVFTNLQSASLQSHLPAFERCQQVTR
jgi:hypothetical protein